MTDAMKNLMQNVKFRYIFGYSKINEWIHDSRSINIHVMRINVARFLAAGTVAGMDEDAASS